MVGGEALALPGCQSRVDHDGLAGTAVRGFHRGMVPLMRLALAVSFRRIRVRNAGRMPREGAVLLLANHPSTWTDVVLLDSLLGRRFHFLAQEEQFHPWPRGLLLRLHGTLPLWSIEHQSDALARNAVTFRTCEALFDRGEAVAVFPEGVSDVDRGLLPLKHGAARLALFYAARRDGRRLSLVPVGIHYSDRTAFRSDITVSVGKAIPAGTLGAFDARGLEDAARRVTECMADAMRGLVLERMDRSRATLFSVLEHIVAGRSGSLELEPARRLAQSLDDERWKRPEDFARFERRVRRYKRMCAALRVSDQALAERPRTERAVAIAVLALGLVPALLGITIHALPGVLTHAATRRYASEPSQIAFARIASGFLFLSLTYATGILLLLAIRVPALWIAGILILSMLLGVVALRYFRWARFEWERWRVAWISRPHGRLVRRVRREHDLLRARVSELLT